MKNLRGCRTLIAVIGVVCVGIGGARAWVATTSYFLNPGTHWRYNVDSDLANSPSWRLGSNPATSIPSNTDVLLAIDRAAQSWNMNGRASVSLSVNQQLQALPENACFATPTQSAPDGGKCPGLVNGVNEVIHGPAPSWFANTIAITAGGTNSEQDIIFFDNARTAYNVCGGGVGGMCFSNITGAEAVRTFQKAVEHEFGHALGLGHGGTATNSVQPLMVDGSFGWNNPSPDDVLGVRAMQWTAAGVLNQPVGLKRGNIGAGGTISWSDDILAADSAFQSVTIPRIACQIETSSPDCVVTTVIPSCFIGGITFSNCLRMVALGLGGDNQWHITSSVTTLIQSFTPVDVAMSVTGQRAVAVLRDATQTLPAMRYVTWNLANASGTITGLMPAVTLAVNGQPADITVPGNASQAQPRVTYHWGLNRYVAVWYDNVHRFIYSVSDANGANWTTPAVLQFNSFTRAPMGQFDVHCPTRTLSDGQNCRILFHDLSMASAVAGEIQARRDGQATICKFTISGVVASGMTCNQTDINQAAVVSLTDYGLYAPAGAPAGPGWLATVSNKVPDANLNTFIEFNLNPFGTFTGTSVVSSFDVPALGASFSRWGGLSCDFVPWAQRFLCVNFTGGWGW